jgi:hypothetical protein
LRLAYERGSYGGPEFALVLRRIGLEDLPERNIEGYYALLGAYAFTRNHRGNPCPPP